MTDDVEIRFDEDRGQLHACLGGREAGNISVGHGTLDWGFRTIVPCANIGGVGTKEEFRGRGIASRMMEKAVEVSRAQGFPIGSVTTGVTNISRRLYAKSGYTYLFTVDQYERKPGPADPSPPPPGVDVRPFRRGDETAMVESWNRAHTERGFFGGFPRTPEGWLAKQKKTLADHPDTVLVARRGADVAGWAAYYHQWLGLTRCELHVEGGPDAAGTAAALLTRLERAMHTAGLERFCFDVSPHQTACRDALLLADCVPRPSFVFQVALFDVQSLLTHLRPLFQLRLRDAGDDAWPARLRIEADGQSGEIELEGGASATDTVLSGDRDVVTRVLCGITSAWEAYMTGELSIRGSFPEFDRHALDAYLGTYPWFHSMRDRA